MKCFPILEVSRKNLYVPAASGMPSVIAADMCRIADTLLVECECHVRDLSDVSEKEHMSVLFLAGVPLYARHEKNAIGNTLHLHPAYPAGISWQDSRQTICVFHQAILN